MNTNLHWAKTWKVLFQKSFRVVNAQVNAEINNQVAVAQAAPQPADPSPQPAFDSSSLQNYDNAQVQPLSDQERQDRLQSLLSESGISRGMPTKSE